MALLVLVFFYTSSIFVVLSLTIILHTMLINQSVIADVQAIIHDAKDKAIRLVDHERTLMYWQIGQRIFEEEQQGKDRADYGNYLTKFIADQLEPEYGSGFSKRQIELFRQFYRTFPIANALRSQLGWTHYNILLRLDSQDKIDFYIAEAIKNNWTTRQLERQIHSSLWERLLMSNDKGSVLAVKKNAKSSKFSCSSFLHTKFQTNFFSTYIILPQQLHIQCS
jgi:hypothetical protein